MQATCSINWAALYPSAPVFVNATRRPSDVSITSVGKDTLIDLHAQGSANEDFAPTFSTFTSRAQREPMTASARASVVRDLKACAVLQPKGSSAGVQLRRAATELQK